jgi:hypothetical protein
MIRLIEPNPLVVLASTIISAALFVGTLYVAIHFIIKWW